MLSSSTFPSSCTCCLAQCMPLCPLSSPFPKSLAFLSFCHAPIAAKDFKERKLKPSMIRDVTLTYSRDTYAQETKAMLRERSISSLAWETLHAFPKQELLGKVVLVRCDFSLSIRENHIDMEPIVAAIPTISYLQSCGARIVIASHWSSYKFGDRLLDGELIADCISQQLGTRIPVMNSVVGPSVKKQIEMLSNGDVLLLGNLNLYKEEAANDRDFAKQFTEHIDILINDAFSISHRVLASTVGAACFTSSRLAGFQLERELHFLTKAMTTPELPFAAVIGGSRLSQSIGLLHKLLDRCNTIIVTGSMVFTFFNALGYHCPSSFIEKNLTKAALKLLSTANERKVHLVLPVDLLCCNKDDSYRSFAADNIAEGWFPVSLGPDTLENIQKTLFTSRMALWIGRVSIGKNAIDLQNSRLIARTFAEITHMGCLTIVGGTEAKYALQRENLSTSVSHISRGGAAFMKALRGISLPGIAALDIACTTVPAWEKIYEKPKRPLFVDIGCGNGLFILRMARSSKYSVNFLGLEVRKKLVDQCIQLATDENLANVHFIQADAATMFKRILAHYPGEVASVAIQCPVPNFSNVDCRRRMVQKQLVKQIIDILPKGGQVFLQSDVKSVAIQLKQEFMELSDGLIQMSALHQDSAKCDGEGWLHENPYEVSTDWEDHVLQRGKRMYRVLLSRN